MRQIRIHGRGGQGVVTAAEILSVAAFLEGKHAQAFPSFGSERMGAPVVAFCRIDERPIQLREPITAPDAVVVQDATLLGQIDVLGGLCSDGIVIVNSARTVQELALGRTPPDARVHCIAATTIALQHIGRPLPNAVMLGALAALSGWLDIESICRAIQEKFQGAVAQKNVAAAQAAYHIAQEHAAQPAAI